MHIDLNAFFASAEQLRDPSTLGKPLAVGGRGRRAVISTASYEARKYGVHSAQPVYQALKLCPDLILKPVDFRFYHILSNSFFGYLERYSRLIEPVSIDEGFVDLTLYLKDKKEPLEALKEIQQGLLKEVGLPCSIGIGPTKFLAKMASDMKKPLGITILRRRDIKDKLYPLPIEDFFGIGKQSAAKLKERFSIFTIGDLKKKMDGDEESLKHFFGKQYESIKDHINGYGSDVVDPTPRDPKSIGRSVTLEHDSDDLEEIFSIFEVMAEEIMGEMRKHKKASKTVDVTFRDGSFITKSKSMTYKEPIRNEKELLDAAKSIYKANFLGKEARLVGLTLQNLYNPKDMDIQMSFWDYETYEEEDKTRLIISKLNNITEKKYDKPLFKRGSEAKKDGDK